MSELFKLGIKEAREGLAKGDFTSVELTQAIIDRSHAENPKIGAYLTFDEEGALAAARANFFSLMAVPGCNFSKRVYLMPHSEILKTQVEL